MTAEWLEVTSRHRTGNVTGASASTRGLVIFSVVTDFGWLAF